MTALIQKLKSLSQLKLNAIANYAGNFWSNLLSFLLVPVYLHYLGVEAYGLIGGFYAVISFVGLLDLGLSATIKREVSLRKAIPEKVLTIPDLLRTTEIIYWCTGTVILLLMVLLAQPISTQWINAENLDLKTVKWAVIILGLTVAIRWPVTTYRGTLIALEKQVQLNILEVILKTFRELGAVVILVMISPTIIAFLLWQAFIAIVEVLLIMVFAWRYVPKTENRPSFKLEILQQTWRFAVGVSWTTIVSMMLSQIDKILLSKFVSLEQFGYYMLASTLAQKLSIILEPFVVAISPQLIILAAQPDEQKFIDFFHKSNLFISLTVIPVASTFIFFAPIILELWTQSPDVAAQASSVLAILTFGAMLDNISTISSQLQLAIGKPQIAAIFNSFSLVLIIPAMLYIVPELQLLGAALIKTFLNILYYLVLSRITHWYILHKEYRRWLIQDTLIPMLMCFTVFFLALQLQTIFSGKLLAVFCILTAITLSYGVLFRWYKYQLKVHLILASN
ncbi:lipopolysaccharide biosynthesis protein [Rivularia sp. UHCC 0363]|uniref:lipopolysaccharide biosynthesis protein n=1 Tax=Rivularia sp. UHCC 0363 TaxID=3110244 RepID=UPI002B1ED114|nr:oligosaccharide flippase family protein [Rivularia sp. UHCC 0363]MEA5593453.1 oligosaccharide flippase family protein [Rivularia sp. UHCC 0363]